MEVSINNNDKVVGYGACGYFFTLKEVIKVKEQQELHDDLDDHLTVEDIEDLMGINRDVYKVVKGRVKRAEVSEMLE